MASPSTQTAVAANHFRPLRYEVHAEVDRLFGMSHAQKRQLHLRHRDIEGGLWFDNIEEEEFQHLLHKRRSISAISSPSTPRTADPFSPSIWTSASPNGLQSAPCSPCELQFQPILALEQCIALASPTSSTGRRRSSATLMVRTTSMPYNREARRLSRSKEPQSPLQLAPLVADDLVDAIVQLKSTKTPLRGPLDRPQSDTPPLLERRRRKRMLSADTAVRRNAVSVDQRLLSADEGYGHLDQSSLPAQLSSDDAIKMPAFLPLSRHCVNQKLLNEAFGVPAKTESVTPTTDGSDISSYLSKQATLPSQSAALLPSPTPFALPSSLSEQPFAAAMPSRRVVRPHDPSSRALRVSLNHTRMQQQQRSSTSVTRANTTSSRQAGLHQRQSSHGSILQERPKAAAMLGITANNENLLVPGGLGTGEHVYDGIEIPCASIYLASDDEDDEKAKTGSRLGRRRRK